MYSGRINRLMENMLRKAVYVFCVVDALTDLEFNFSNENIWFSIFNIELHII